MQQTTYNPNNTQECSSDERDTELVPPSDPRASLISIDPERHSGTPCFTGTRVPIKDLFDYLEDGGTMESFLESFPTVTHNQAVQVLQSSSTVANM